MKKFLKASLGIFIFLVVISHFVDNKSDRSRDTTEKKEVTSASNEAVYGKELPDSLYNKFHNDLFRSFSLSKKCEARDPDDVNDDLVCPAANILLLKLSQNGICLRDFDSMTWVTCKPGSEIDRVYAGKTIKYYTTDGNKRHPPVKLIDPGGRLTTYCTDTMEEVTLADLMKKNDPYAFKGKCFIFPFPREDKVQWIDEKTILIPRQSPRGAAIVLSSANHPKLGEKGVFLGIDPMQYGTAITFRLITYPVRAKDGIVEGE